MDKSKQTHLSRKSQIDLGSFYTPNHLVQITSDVIKKNIKNTTELSLIDTSCGYGSFLNIGHFKKTIGVDIDIEAINQAKKSSPKASLYISNSLQGVSRNIFDVDENEKIIIVGNPPYNDTTSIIRQATKDKTATNAIDRDIKTRDLGMSFLLSYNKLRADYVCVLHPLSYLIKKANFALIRKFAENYKLVDGLVISSHEFSDTSKSMAFPILIAFYKRDKIGMNYEFIKNYKFKVKDGGTFRLSDFDTIANYVQKYPNANKLRSDETPIAKFWTLRDINALRRNRTFIDIDTYNAVYITLDKLPYYCYIDVFKQYLDKIPFFLGNYDVFIDNDEFIKIKDSFVYQSIKTNPILKKNIKFREVPNAKQDIDKYFSKLLNERLGEKYAADFNK